MKIHGAKPLPTGAALEWHLLCVVPEYASIRPRRKLEKMPRGCEGVYVRRDGRFVELTVDIETGETVAVLGADACGLCARPKSEHTKRIRHTFEKGRVAA